MLCHQHTDQFLQRRSFDDLIELVESEIDAMRSALRNKLPALASGALVQTVTCLYTLTPDHHFIVDFHPRYPRVLISSPCSGHGFKFASVVGEVVADLAMKKSSALPIGFLSLSRFK